MNDKLSLPYLVLVLVFTALLTVGLFAVLPKPLEKAVEWVNFGITLYIFIFVMDFVHRINPRLLSWKPIFTNIQDAITLLIALITASIFINLPENLLLQYNTFFIRLIFAIVGAILCWGIVRVFGTPPLKSRFTLRQKSDISS